MPSQHRLNVLVYNGSGVSDPSRDAALSALRALLSENYDVQLATPKVLTEQPWQTSTALLVFPGGRDVPYHHDLHGAAGKIRSWVRDGGAYLGFCAGGYFGSADIAFRVPGRPEWDVVAPRELRFFPGTCRGPVYPGFEYGSDRGAREARVQLNRSVFRGVWDQSPEWAPVWYNGGGWFDLSSSTSLEGRTAHSEVWGDLADESSTGPASTGDAAGPASAIPESVASQPASPDIDILGTYDGTRAAGVRCRVGRGSAVLWGVHPEQRLYDAARLAQLAQRGTPIDPTLIIDEVPYAEKEARREGLLRASLRLLGLHVAAATTAAAPQLLPLFLASRDAEEGAALEGRWLSRFGPVPAAEEVGEVEKKLADVKLGEGATGPEEEGKSAPASPAVSASASSAIAYLADRHDTFALYPASSAASLLSTATSTPGSGDTDQYHAQLKQIVILPDPNAASGLTPLFSLPAYFEHLSTAGASVFGRTLLYGESLTSTQTLMDKNDAFAALLPHGFVCLASHQIAGRGRGTNAWVSPAGCLQFSFMMKVPASAASRIVFVQYLLGLAVVEAVKTVPGYEDLGVCLKWPNDIYADVGEGQGTHGPKSQYSKIGGILINSSYDGQSFVLVAGCGINTNNPRPTTSVNELVDKLNDKRLMRDPSAAILPHFSQEKLLALILAQFEKMWPVLVEKGFSPFIDTYLERWIHQNQQVTIEATNQLVKIVGITPDFGLLRTVPIASAQYGDELYRTTTAHSLPQYIDLQPDGNGFDMLQNMIVSKAM